MTAPKPSRAMQAGRVCTICDSWKPWAEFSRSIRGVNGHRSQCRKCFAAAAKARYVPRVRQPERKMCPQCGQEFTYQPTTGPRRVYCSRRCTAAHGEELKLLRNADLPPRQCACGSTDVAGVGKPVCPACQRKISPEAQKRRNDRDRCRTLARYGLTQAEYDGLVKRQRNRCAVCKAGKPGGPPTRNGYWLIDHDHVTGQVRGLLCGKCNAAIGLLQDDPKIIKAAAQYVERHRQMELFSRKAG